MPWRQAHSSVRKTDGSLGMRENTKGNEGFVSVPVSDKCSLPVCQGK